VYSEQSKAATLFTSVFRGLRERRVAQRLRQAHSVRDGLPQGVLMRRVRPRFELALEEEVTMLVRSGAVRRGGGSLRQGTSGTPRAGGGGRASPRKRKTGPGLGPGHAEHDPEEFEIDSANAVVGAEEEVEEEESLLLRKQLAALRRWEKGGSAPARVRAKLDARASRGFLSSIFGRSPPTPADEAQVAMEEEERISNEAAHLLARRLRREVPDTERLLTDDEGRAWVHRGRWVEDVVLCRHVVVTQPLQEMVADWRVLPEHEFEVAVQVLGVDLGVPERAGTSKPPSALSAAENGRRGGAAAGANTGPVMYAYIVPQVDLEALERGWLPREILRNVDLLGQGSSVRAPSASSGTGAPRDSER